MPYKYVHTEICVLNVSYMGLYIIFYTPTPTHVGVNPKSKKTGYNKNY